MGDAIITDVSTVECVLGQTASTTRTNAFTPS
jgi:hypothetical protein